MVTDLVRLRFLVAGGQPIVVAAVPAVGRGLELTAALRRCGLPVLEAFLGVDLPRGAGAGFVLAPGELRLVDDRDDTLLRAPRDEVDPQWVAASRRLRGTMFLAVDRLELPSDAPAGAVAAAVDARARSGGVLGAIVGVAEERPRLPLMLSS